MPKNNSKSKVTFPAIFEYPFYTWFEDYIKSLNLPISYTANFIGVGPIKTMYLCWITKYGQSYLFNSRKSLVKDLKENREKVLFNEDNKELIVGMISHILSQCEDYMENNNSSNDDTDEYGEDGFEVGDSKIDNVDVSDNVESASSLDEINSLIKTMPENSFEIQILTSLINSLKVNITESPDMIFKYPAFISNRLKNCLCRNGYMNFNDLSNAKADDLFEMKHFGRKSLEELISILTNFAPCKVPKVNKPLDEIEEIEFDLKLTPLILHDEIFIKNKIKDVDENRIEFYQSIANDYIECINNCFENNLSLREVDILKRYYFNDGKVTLQIIGDEFGITRERVRQILKKSFRKLLSKFNNSSNFKNKGRAIYLFNKISADEFINFIKYGFLLNMNILSTKFYLLFLYKEDVVDKILSICEDSIKGKVVKPGKYDDFVELNVVYPSNINIKIVPESIISVEKLNYSYLINAMKKFMNIPKVSKVIPNPNIYYRENNSTKYNPDFALIYEDKIILVIVLNTINLGFYYNLLRFNDLHQYCKENGYGYIIISERFKSFFDIKKTDIEPELEDWLLNILEKRKVINWRDILTLKGKFVITNEKIVAFVIKHKLKFTLNPFVIRKNT